jgi:hypothetical protein
VSERDLFSTSPGTVAARDVRGARDDDRSGVTEIEAKRS